MPQEHAHPHIGRTREDRRRRGRSAGCADRRPEHRIIYMDDMGWSDPGCYGSEIDTPHIDALAARGLRFTHYTTHPLCSPARAALLTGMNAHAVGTGWLANNNAGYPGYSGEIPLDAPTLAETFRAAGYETIMTGKWHNTPTRRDRCIGEQAKLARAARLRHVLRLHGGRGALLLSRAADDRKPARADRRVSARLLRDRRLDELRDRIRESAARVIAGQAVPALHRA